MLKKLLKYEIQATSRIFLPMYALLIVFALINRFFITVNSDYLKIPMVIAMSVFVIVIVGICAMTLLVTIQRFNKNLLSDEGYLSFTLPVKIHTQIDCKMIVTLMWFVLSSIISVLSIFVMVIDAKGIDILQRFFSEFLPVFNSLGAAGYVIILEGIILVIIATLSFAAKIYAAISIGNMSSKHRLLVALGSYVGFGVVEQIISSIVFSPFGSRMELYFRSLTSPVQMAGAAQIGMLLMILYGLIFGAVYYFLTNWLLKRKLNLE
jgi:hypothetical protein